jgi:hypothetical protein
MIITRLTAMRPGNTSVIEGVVITRCAADRYEVGMIPTVEVLDRAGAAAEVRVRGQTESARLIWVAMCHSGRPTIGRNFLASRIAGLAAAAGRRITIAATRNAEDAVYSLGDPA